MGVRHLPALERVFTILAMNRRVVAVSIILLIVCALIGFWLTAGRSGRRTYQEYVALDGIGPAELIDPPNGTDAVILYRIGRNRVVCYDVFWSKRLHDQLPQRKGKPLPLSTTPSGTGARVMATVDTTFNQ